MPIFSVKMFTFFDKPIILQKVVVKLETHKLYYHIFCILISPYIFIFFLFQLAQIAESSWSKGIGPLESDDSEDFVDFSKCLYKFVLYYLEKKMSFHFPNFRKKIVKVWPIFGALSWSNLLKRPTNSAPIHFWYSSVELPCWPLVQDTECVQSV